MHSVSHLYGKVNRNYQQPGLYLFLNNGKEIILTRERIEKLTKIYWSDPEKIPDDVKKSANFKRCNICPLKGKESLCDAVRPVLPLINDVDEFVSFEKVTALYKSGTDNRIFIANTTIQDALTYIAILSLISYCKVGRKYWKYYFGIIPLMSVEEFVGRLYLNIYWLNNGDEEKINNIIRHMIEELAVTTNNQLKRLMIISKNDAFLNAFAGVQSIIEYLEIIRSDTLKEAMNKFVKNYYFE